MKTVNDEFIKKLNTIKSSITGTSIPQKSVLLDRLNALILNIEEGEFDSFHFEGFYTLKLMIKAKLALKKSAPDSDAFLHISSSIQSLREPINEADEVIDGIICEAGALRIIWPVMLITVVVVTFLFSHIFH
ncbi:hypothetical protein QCD58_004578 [Enterobacter hormaechei]|nr:hypothetical protein [Enterobacter hormaechei]